MEKESSLEFRSTSRLNRERELLSQETNSYTSLFPMLSLRRDGCLVGMI